MLTTQQEGIAWRVVLISAFMAFIIFGIRLSFSVFFAEFVTVEGWTNEASASIFSVSMVVFAIVSPASGIMLDRYGPRAVFTTGVLLVALGLFLSSRVNTVELLLITYGIIGGIGLAIVGLGQVAANIAGWVPPASRGRAIGIAFAGTGLGSLIFVPLSNWLIATFGWRDAYVVLSMICLLILAPMVFVFMRKPPTISVKRNLVGDSKALFRSPIFWLLMLVSLVALGPLRSLTVHQVRYIEFAGFDRSVAANYVGLAGFLTAGAYIMWGWFSDRFGRALAFTLGALSLMCAVGVLFLLPEIGDARILVMYAIFYALGEGTRSSQTTALASDVFQKSGLGLVNGLVGGMFGLGAAFGPWIVGRLRDSTGDYTLGFITVLIMISISIAGFVGIVLLSKNKQS